MIYTPRQLKRFQIEQEVENYLVESFEDFIGPEGGSIELPNEWDSNYVEIAAEILNNQSWEVIPKVNNSFIENGPKKYLVLTPMITLTKEEYTILESSKTAVMSEVVAPNMEKMKVHVVRDGEEEYPPFEVDEPEQGEQVG